MSLDRTYGDDAPKRAVKFETTMPWTVWQTALWLLAEARWWAEDTATGGYWTPFPWEEQT